MVVDSGNSTPQKKQRYFIAYARKGADDQQLAQWLREQLTAAGKDVFLDQGIRIGEQWEEEIPAAIEDSDVFVVLLTKKSVMSKMVREEVYIAHEQHSETGLPLLAPINVRFSEELGYGLGAYLRPFQFFEWQSDADSKKLLDELLEVAPRRSLSPGPRRPQRVVRRAAVRPGSIRTPGGGMTLNDPMYIERKADEEVRRRLRIGGETSVLLGARQTGKTSLLHRCQVSSHKANKRYVRVDLSGFGEQQLESVTSLLCHFATHLLDELDLSTPIGDINSTHDFSRFIRERIINPLGGKLVLAIDEADRVFEYDYRTDFFGMIRSWHNARGYETSGWRDVDLLLAISTEPHLLMEDRYQSPFNVSEPIKLEWFDDGQVYELNDRYGQPFSDTQVGKVCGLTGGHPYLTQLACYKMRGRDDRETQRLLDEPTDRGGVFADHLNRLEKHLAKRPEYKLLEHLQKIIELGALPTEEVIFRLLAAGLVRWEGNRLVCVNELYARFFRSLQ